MSRLIGRLFINLPVDDQVARALTAGRRTDDQPQEFGFIYTRGYLDPDGHGRGVLHLRAG